MLSSEAQSLFNVWAVDPQSTGPHVEYLELYLLNFAEPDETLPFVTNDLPSYLSLADFDDGSDVYFTMLSAFAGARAEVDTFSANPEPGTGVLVSLGLFGIAARRRSLRRR